MKVVSFGEMSGRADVLAEPSRIDREAEAEQRDIELRNLIRENRLGEAGLLVLTLIDKRIAAGDSELATALTLLRHYEFIISQLPPLWHVGAVPLRPDERLYTCFDQFIELIRLQQHQIGELQAMISEIF
jgi:hypothetical protein